MYKIVPENQDCSSLGYLSQGTYLVPKPVSHRIAPEFQDCAVLIRERLRPLRLLDNLEAGADADDLTPRHPLGNWLILQESEYEICDDDEIVHMLSGPQYEYD